MSQRAQTILITDPDEHQRQSLCHILRKHGYRVLQTADYDAAVNVCRIHTSEIDLLLTAIALPEDNGLRLAQELREREPALKVLFMSAPAGAELCKFYGLQTAEVHLLHKPLQADQLLDRVEKVLGGEINRSVYLTPK